VGYIAFNGDVMRELAAQFLTLAEKQGATVPLMIGHRLVGSSLLCAGDMVEGRRHFDHAFALYDPADHSSLATRFGQDHGVTTLGFRSWALWLLGYPKAAQTDADRAIKDAREIGQAATLMFALTCVVWSYILCGNYAAINSLLDELVLLADEKSAAWWKSSGMLMRGWFFSLTGKGAEAVETITWGLTTERSIGATAFIPARSSDLARAYADLGRFDDAWRSIDEAMTAMEATKERWWEAEISRVAGEVALKSPERDGAKAETYFEHALAIARQQAKSWELRQQ
jgi:predicted ATPase